SLVSMPASSKRCRAGYSDPSSTRSTSSLRDSIATAIAYPCMEPRANIRRISMSRVPCTSSPVPRCFGIDYLYLDGLYLDCVATVSSFFLMESCRSVKKRYSGRVTTDPSARDDQSASSCSAVLEAAAHEKKPERAKGQKAEGKIGSSRP